MGKATQDLRNEHEDILYVLRILDQMMLSKDRDEKDMLHYYDELMYFLKTFVDKCHHGKEENYLFKELIKKGGPDEAALVRRMLKEHAEGRELIAEMNQYLGEKDVKGFHRAAAPYRDLLRSHIEKETNELFPVSDTMIDEAEQDSLFQKFEDYEENVMGHGIHEKLHAMIHVWEEAFGVE